MNRSMRAASLPMYNLPEIRDANATLWSALRGRLELKGLDVTDIEFSSENPAVPEDDGRYQFFTQVCGFPLFKLFRGRYRLLAAPTYDYPGCGPATHRAYFMVRATDPATGLTSMRGRVFGCNSLLSNSGMNLPRRELAKLPIERPFFSAVKLTGAHSTSLEWLAEGKIDLCSIDCVTWGQIQKFRPESARHFRVLSESGASPTLPFVTSAHTPDAEATAIVEALNELVADPAFTAKEVIGLSGIVAPDLAAYERLMLLESESERLGYGNIQ